MNIVFLRDINVYSLFTAGVVQLGLLITIIMKYSADSTLDVRAAIPYMKYTSDNAMDVITLNYTQKHIPFKVT